MNNRIYPITRKILKLPALGELELYPYIECVPKFQFPTTPTLEDELMHLGQIGYWLTTILQPTATRLDEKTQPVIYLLDGEAIRHRTIGYELTLTFILKHRVNNSYVHVHSGLLYYTPKQLHNWLKPRKGQVPTTTFLSDKKDNGSKPD